MKFSIIGLIFIIFLSGCKEESEQLKKENMNLRAKINSLNTELNALKNSDVSIYAKAMEMFREADKATTWKDSVGERRKSLALFEKLIAQYPNSKSSQQARSFLPTAKRKLATEELAMQFYQEAKLGNTQTATGLLSKIETSKEMIKPDELTKMKAYLDRKKNAPMVFSSHAEFYKASQTGMTIGKKYAVYSCQDQMGSGLYDESAKLKLPTLVRFKHDFTGDKARELFDYREKCLCFELRLMSNSEIWVEDFYSGKCED